MSFRHSVTIVASPRSRVGKTLLARLLTDFHAQEGREVAAFDLNSGGGTLAAFAPERTTISEITSIKGQIALFDRLIADDGVTKVVDLGHESFAGFFALASQIGFVEEAHRRAIAPAVLFVVTPDATAVEAFRSLRARFPQATLTPVHNEIFGTAQHRDKYQLTGHGETMVHLPLLAPGVRKYIDTPPFSFADAALAANVTIPLAVQSELQSWLRRVWREFRELDLRLLLADLQSSIGHGSA
jgi:Mrp family chromosome partitioning ATPase